ncbi:probable protein, unknown function [Plasmodium sp. gorilla clade G1]|nr:probable protein, unknown function [Plasmodium sp. gorilla clade G1]
MDNFKIIYASIIRFNDKIPIFTYHIKVDSQLRIELVKSLNVYFRSTSIAAFPGGTDVFPFDDGIIYSLYNKNLTLIYIIITQKEYIENKYAFFFLQECMNELEKKIDFTNLMRLPKNKYSRTFTQYYQQLIKKYNAEVCCPIERLDKKIIRILSTVCRGIETTLKNKQGLTKLESRMNSLSFNARLVSYVFMS